MSLIVEWRSLISFNADSKSLSEAIYLVVLILNFFSYLGSLISGTTSNSAENSKSLPSLKASLLIFA